MCVTESTVSLNMRRRDYIRVHNNYYDVDKLPNILTPIEGIYIFLVIML